MSFAVGQSRGAAPLRFGWAGAAAGLAVACLAPFAAAAPSLQFDVAEGRNLNSFLREGQVAAHLVLRAGADPRLLVAFPAGDSGVGLWFAHTQKPVTWTLTARPRPVTLRDARGRPLYGLEADVEARGGDLAVKQALLSSVRILRDYESGGAAPKPVLSDPVIAGDRISWSRDRSDGAAGYRLVLQVTHGALGPGGLSAASDGRIGLRLTAVSGETPLSPLGGAALLDAGAGADLAARNTLNFLSYKEKFLAGSWRFDTYFGRDSLMSVRLLLPVLQPEAVEGGLRSVLARLSAEGEVAHEEAIGDYAALDHLRTSGEASAAPEFDYGMIDGSYMLAPVAAAWLLDDPRGRARAAAFLASPSGRAGDAGETVGQALVRNLNLVIARTQAFADDPRAAQLLAIKPGRLTGQWRDSADGLGHGRIPYDVNAVFAPAALSAIARLNDAGLLRPSASPADQAAFARAAGMAKVWRDRAPGLFEVSQPAPAARAAVAVYAKAQGVPAGPALASIGAAGVRFEALSLNADGSPVPVVNSDEGFDLLFGDPSPARLGMAVASLMRPFPAGLMTDVGLLVANPAYAPASLQGLFTRGAYHGLVVWSWQQAVLAAGLERQLKRRDLTPALRGQLLAARKRLWAAIEADRAVANSELWSWACRAGRYRIVAYGAGQADADESNAAQLWSSVFLALKPPN